MLPAADDGGAVSPLVSVAFTDAVDDIPPSQSVLDAFYSLIASSSFSDPVGTVSLLSLEQDALAFVLRTAPPSQPLCPFDLTKAPSSYSEAIACLDALVWWAAMEQECQSLLEMGDF